MKELSTLRCLPALGFALAALSAGACHHDHHYDDDDGGSQVPSFFEVEPNDDAFTANDFGFLAPGDHFFIEGYITDNGFDPFDGFWFTSTGPIHVDFQLFIDDAFTDLDVCLYDPFLDATIDCYQSANNPEQGGIDVTGADIDFHLVVESFVGASTYGLEIVVLPLSPAPVGAASGLASSGTAAPGTEPEPTERLRSVQPRDVAPRGGAEAAAFGKYARAENPTELKRVAVSRFDVDLELGLVIETTTIEQVPVAREERSVKVR